jgi:hypothetical protein
MEATSHRFEQHSIPNFEDIRGIRACKSLRRWRGPVEGQKVKAGGDSQAMRPVLPLDQRRQPSHTIGPSLSLVVFKAIQEPRTSTVGFQGYRPT